MSLMPAAAEIVIHNFGALLELIDAMNITSNIEAYSPDNVAINLLLNKLNKLCKKVKDIKR